MKSPTGQRAYRECKKKHRHKSRGAALAHLRALEKRYGTAADRRAYRCHWCGGWHVGKL